MLEKENNNQRQSQMDPNQYVVITGASRGIGKALAEMFAAHGYSLLLSSRNEVSLYNTLNELQARFPSTVIKAKAFDLSTKEGAIALASWCLDFAIPDILINNAGLFEPGQVHNEPEGLLENQLAVNFHSAYHLTRALLPTMLTRKSGHIFNMCSVASLKAYKDGGAYSISKHALYGFSKNLREELKPFGIKVTSVLPGAVFTDSWSGFDNSQQRIMEAADIAKMIFAATQLSAAACVEEILIRPLAGDL